MPFDPLGVESRRQLPAQFAGPIRSAPTISGATPSAAWSPGARVSLGIALAATGAGLLVGAVLGLLAAWRRGVAELVAMQFVDILLALPELLLAITAITVLGRGTVSTVVAVAVYAVPSFARIVRAAAQPIVVGRLRDGGAGGRARPTPGCCGGTCCPGACRRCWRTPR